MKNREIQDSVYKAKLLDLPAIIESWVREHKRLEGCDILDFGCGEGTTALGLALRAEAGRIVGVDIMPDPEQCLPLARQHLGLADLPQNLSLNRVLPGALHNSSDQFDLIYSWSVFEHIRQDLLPDTVEMLRARLRPGGLLFVQIAPLFYSSEGSHFYSEVPVRWGHLLIQGDIYRQKLAAATADGFEGAWSAFETLNRITAPELLEVIRGGGFEVLRTYTTREEYEIPSPLLHAYREDVLLTNQIVVLARPMADVWDKDGPTSAKNRPGVQLSADMTQGHTSYGHRSPNAGSLAKKWETATKMSDVTQISPLLAELPPPGNWELCNRAKPSPMYGLIRLECAHHSGRPLAGAMVHIAFAGHEETYPAEAMIAPTGAGDSVIRVHLVTHLIPNGQHRLSGQIIWPDGFQRILSTVDYDVQNTGNLASIVRRDLLKFGTPAILEALVDSRMFPQEAGRATAWFNDPDAVADVPLSLEPARSAEAARMHLIRWGFAVLDYVIDADTIAQFRAEYETAIDDGRLIYTRGTSARVHQAHRLPVGRKIWLDDTILGFLREWFRDEPCACQTLLYVNGSEQGAHQDTIHLTPYPAGFMCGVWVALQDVEPQSGELFVLPGSHRSPRLLTHDLGLTKVTDDYSQYNRYSVRIDEVIENAGYEVVSYLPRAGQVLVWHENLIHGGAPRQHPERRRHSIVSHYYARGSVAYYDARGEAATLEQVE